MRASRFYWVDVMFSSFGVDLSKAKGNILLTVII